MRVVGIAIMTQAPKVIGTFYTGGALMAQIRFETEDEKHAFWHTSAHIMAHAVSRLFPDAKFGIGPRDR